MVPFCSVTNRLDSILNLSPLCFVCWCSISSMLLSLFLHSLRQGGTPERKQHASSALSPETHTKSTFAFVVRLHFVSVLHQTVQLTFVSCDSCNSRTYIVDGLSGYWWQERMFCLPLLAPKLRMHAITAMLSRCHVWIGHWIFLERPVYVFIFTIWTTSKRDKKTPFTSQSNGVNEICW